MSTSVAVVRDTKEAHRARQSPFVGRVSMDSIMIDVSNANPDVLRPGLLVDLINDVRTIDRVAALAGTIEYDILTGLGRRSHRTYLGG